MRSANYEVRKLFLPDAPHLAALPLAERVSFLLSFLNIPPFPPSKQHNTHLLFLSSCNQLHFNNLSHSIFVLKNSTARICKKLTPEALATVPVSSLHHILPDISYKVSRFGLAVRHWAGKQKDLGSIPPRLSFLFKKVVVCGHCLVTLSITSY